jgi:hypothetical protein
MQVVVANCLALVGVSDWLALVAVELHIFRNHFALLFTPERNLKSFALFLCHSNKNLVRKRQECNGVKNCFRLSFGLC